MKFLILILLTVTSLNAFAITDVVCINDICAQKWDNPDGSFTLINPIQTNEKLNFETMVAAKPWYLSAPQINSRTSFLYKKSKHNAAMLCKNFGGSGKFTETENEITDFNVFITKGGDQVMWVQSMFPQKALGRISCNK